MLVSNLTPEQESQLPKYRDKWLEIGLQTNKPLPPPDRLRQLIEAVYTAGGLSAPKIIRTAPSPTAGIELAYSEYNIPRKETLAAAIYGTMDAGWLSFYAYFLGELPQVNGPKRLIPLMQLALEGIGWSFVFEGLCIVTQCPTEIHLVQRGDTSVLHNPNGMSVRYADGTGVYALNGVRFSNEEGRKWIEVPANQLDSVQVLAIQNVEQRAEVIKRIGISRMLDKLNPRIIDTPTRRDEHGYQLLGVTIGNYPERKYLRMNNPSVAETHIEAVHPDCTTVEEALQWRNTGEIGKFTAPLVLT